jgi:hypothetical protein
MIYYSYFHYVVTHGLIFWGILFIAIKSSDYKKELLELWWGLGIEIYASDMMEF